MNTILLIASCLLLGATETIVGSEYIVDVPEGETYTNPQNINASDGVTVLVKTGKGTWNTGSRGIGRTTNFEKMEVREGTFEVKCYKSNGGFKPPLMIIKSGATVVQQRSDTYDGNNVTIQVEKGGTFNEANAKSFGYLKAITGAGTVIGLYDAVKGDILADFTGDIVEGLDSSTVASFGDGADAANDPDLSKVGSLTMAGGSDLKGSYPRLTFKNVEPMVVPGRFGGLGQLTFNAGSVVTFSNLWLTAGASSCFSVLGTVTNVNGRLSLGSDSNRFNLNDVAARYVQIGGVAYGAWPTTNLKNIPYSRLKYPNGSSMKGSAGSGYGTRILENGAEFWTQFQQPYRTEVNSGSTLVFRGGSMQNTNAKSADDPVELKFDGGTMLLQQDDSATFTMTYGGLPRFVVGPRGMTIATHGQGSGDNGIPFAEGVVFTDNGSNGPLTFRGNTTTTFNAPLDIGGTVTIEDGTVSIPNKAAYYADGAKPALGTGSVVLNQGRIWSSLPQGKLTRLADAPGATLTLKGASSLRMNSNNTGVDWQIGPTSATKCSIIREKGAALFFENNTDKQSDFFKNNKGTCVIGGGLPLGTNGKLPVVPVFVSDPTSTHSGDGSFGEVDFLTYGATGLVRFENYARAFGGDAKDVVFIGVSTNLAENVTVAGLNVGNDKTVTIASGVTLTVGDGTGTACVLLNSGTIKGAGTLDFGAAEGVITTNPRDDTISARIAGTGGLTVVNSYKSDVNGYVLKLSGDNTYSGGTRISTHRVLVGSDTAFGTGDVWALGGEGAGGQIRFNDSKKYTLANNLHLSGRGRMRGASQTLGGNFMGAIWAMSDAELTGAVELAGPTRMTVQGGATELTFSGVISGDAVEFYNYDESIANAGTVVYAAANTYTGKTEVVRTTLVLEPGAKAGTGEMVLDGAELVLKMEKSGVTMPNVLRGAGTVRLAGPSNAPITFAAHPTDDPFYQAENTLDLNNRSRAVNSLAGFTSVTNTGTRAVHLSVLDDAEGSFAGEVAPNVTLHYGEVYAKGLAVIIR